MEAAERKRLMAVARREAGADLILRGGTVCNVYSRETYRADVVVAEGRIAYVGDAQGFAAAEERDVAGLFVAPGLIEPHAHPWILYNPRSYAEALLPRGITAAACDDLPLRHVYGRRLGEAFRAIERLPLSYYWLLRIGFYGPREDPAGPGEAILPQDEILESLATEGVIGLAELNRWLSVLGGPDDVLAAFTAARRRGQVVQGHTAGARERELNLLALAGVDSCHEAITTDEARLRLRLGLYTMLRHSSLRQDLPALQPLLSEDVDLTRVMLTTDGSSPAHIAREGHVDGMLRRLAAAGVPWLAALQLATIHPATYLGLEAEIGGIAPGRRADVVLYRRPAEFTPELVLAGGELVAERGHLTRELDEIAWPAVDLPPFDVAGLREEDLLLPYTSPVEAITFVDSVLTRSGTVELPRLGGSFDLSGREDLMYAALVARDGRFVSRALVGGLMTGLAGFATSYLLDGHLLVLGREPASMLLALREVARRGGGFLHVQEGAPEWFLPLPLFGVMTDGPFAQAVRTSKELEGFAQAHGYRFADPAYSLHFLVGDFLPGPRLTARGQVDAKTGSIVYPALRRA